ncbi:MAG TPA: efflux RND transporter periplasmic adaptor subunit [Bryobacteraceae bacterium]|nr:efflux RND transporter periplasmic adaptor subunit [Bryobacteraceae bacterium]
MRYTNPDRPGVSETAEESLRQENQNLRRQLEELKALGHGSPSDSRPPVLWHPSGITIWAILLGAAVLVAVAFFAGYIPLRKQQNLLASEEQQRAESLPRVEVIEVSRSTRNSDLELPGNIQAVTEAPILARASGYISRRLVDIGDRVKAGQELAEIDAPELDDQVRQAKATVEQARASLDQATANLQQGQADMDLARVTAERWSVLVTRGAVSRQENDQYQAQFKSKAASVRALEKAVNVQRNSVAAAESNVARLENMQSYRFVRAPFDGVITLRNVDTGALVNAGNTLLFRVAQTGALRTYVNVPQTNASSVRPGQAAALTVSNLPGREFAGTVARSSNALDPASRTLLVEVHVPNPTGELLPGMYAQVDLSSARTHPPFLIPGDALIVRADGAQVAVVQKDHTVHLQKIQVGRDYGDRLEVVSGLREGDTIVPNPGDVVREGVKVDPVPVADTAGQQAAKSGK